MRSRSSCQIVRRSAATARVIATPSLVRATGSGPASDASPSTTAAVGWSDPIVQASMAIATTVRTLACEEQLERFEIS
jgi:hypothetical protein